ncbi:molybdopterin synthase catalytic subunit MoaE [Aliagarivorans taiwanensis]|uniref:molybdopterin synthase catalytic subunit MoaE n=1 Tax=Aliagarivorans taiwanensis TaxID=561966 RepID=UPI0012F82C7C|nr:molybdopterin synthase catalytic subunit MoaE [Aliagarivorans taiwanensis]
MKSPFSPRSQADSRVISVQKEDFDVAALYQALQQNPSSGAVVTFTGLVRDLNLGTAVNALFIEHYPGMTERALSDIVEQAKQRWPINDVAVVHRVGRLEVNQQIVFVGVNSAHRQAAFDACEFIMDYLKTSAPFWKKELSDQGEQWLEQRESDRVASKRWS